MCETAVSQKIDLLARMESVLIAESVKMSECSSTQPSPAQPRGDKIDPHLLSALPKRHVSDHAVLHS